MAGDATREGVSEDRSGEDAERGKSPREEALASMMERFEEHRAGEFEEVSDPGEQEHGVGSDEGPENDPGSDTSLTPSGGQKEHLPEHLQDDPLADYIVMDGDAPMMRAKVDGEETLVPLDRVRATIQKDMAADRRLEVASQRERELTERERQIQETERQWVARLEGLQNRQGASPPPGTGVDDEAEASALAEAKDVITSIFDGEDDTAAEKLARVIAGRRVSEDRTSLDPQTIAQQAAEAARNEIEADRRARAEEEERQDIVTGWQKFEKDFADIASDPMLFGMAEGMTTRIQEEHPDWKPSQVMLEAGSQVKQWLEERQAGAQGEPEGGPDDRRSRKRRLPSMPTGRTGSPAPEQEEPVQTPRDYLADIRRMRGQGA